MNRASVCEWHKRFKEGRESLSDDETCGRSKEVRTPELIGQIKNFMDKDRRVSIETISAQFDVSMWTVHKIIREELKMRKICAKFVPRVLREDQNERRCHDSREMVELIKSDPAVNDALVTCNENWIYSYDPETKRQSSQWKHADSPRPKKARQSKFTHKHLMIFFLTALAWSTCTGFPLDRQSVAFSPGQCISPQLHPCQRLFDQDGHQDSFSPSLLSRPCSLWLLVIPKAQGKT